MSRYFPKNIEELVHWYERYISPLSLIAGFFADNLFLTRRVDLLQTNLLFGFYLILAALGIILINLIEAGKIHSMRVVRMAPVVPIIVQFCMGGLLSGYLSLYSRSASLAVGPIFVAVIAALLLGNERFARFYVRMSVQMSMYFGALFSFLIFFLPVVFHKIGPLMFLLSGTTSLLLIALFLWFMMMLVPARARQSLRRSVMSIAGIFVILNALYFGNLLPPLPLALKEAGVYHAVSREQDGSYVLTGEPIPWYQYYLNYSSTYHIVAGEPVYVFTSVFSPTGLSVSITHEWQIYDTAAGAWITQSTVSFPINGGRDGGYRGYSIKYNPAPGKWRVRVRTEYGQLIGNVAFTVVSTESEPALVTKTE